MIQSHSVYKGGICIIYSKWKLHLVKVIYLDDIYTLVYKFSEYLGDHKWKEWPEFELIIPGNKDTSRIELKKIPDLPFKMKVTELYINSKYIHQSVLEIQYIDSFSSLDISARIKRTREYKSSKQRKVKRPKIDDIQHIDILLIGTNHEVEEDMLKLYFGSLNNEFLLSFKNDTILTEKNNGTEKHRLPYLFFWEHPPISENESTVKIKELDGTNSASFNISGDSDTLGALTFLQSAISAYNYPLSIGVKDKDKYYLKNEDDSENFLKQAELINYRIESSHGTQRRFDNMKHSAKLYGKTKPVGNDLTWVFITDLWINYLNNNNELAILKIIFHDANQLKRAMLLLRNITNKILKSNSGLLFSLQSKIAKKIAIKNDSDDNLRIMKELVVDNTTGFNNKTQLHILHNKVIFEFILANNVQDLTDFVYEFYSLICMGCNSSFINMKTPPSIELNNNSIGPKTDEMIIDNKDITLSETYFSLLADKIKNDLYIDIPTLYVNNFFYYLKKNGVFLDVIDYEEQAKLTVNLRNILTFYHIINVCKENNIKRCIISYGSGHIEHLQNFINQNTSPKLRLNSTYFSLNSNKIKILYYEKAMELYNLKKGKKFIEKITEFGKILTLYFNIEQIDKWLYDTEYINHENVKKSTFDNHNTMKLQYYLKLMDKFDELKTYVYKLDNKFFLPIDYIGIYIGLLYFSNPSMINGKINNNTIQYTSIYDLDNNINLKYVSDWIKEGKIENARLRRNGPFVRYGYGNIHSLNIVEIKKGNNNNIFKVVSKLIEDMEQYKKIYI